MVTSCASCAASGRAKRHTAAAVRAVLSIMTSSSSWVYVVYPPYEPELSGAVGDLRVRVGAWRRGGGLLRVRRRRRLHRDALQYPGPRDAGDPRLLGRGAHSSGRDFIQGRRDL